MPAFPICLWRVFYALPYNIHQKIPFKNTSWGFCGHYIAPTGIGERYSNHQNCPSLSLPYTLLIIAKTSASAQGFSSEVNF
ncbi:hypothetical protein A2Z23_02255 [Candidatus Curtissbacteria bacterium RBG_16_39_7]|uniref:Uncharacterized protein n=1 Tax=Candidatus Curtissbacteria bacterium RBG_16_39_7 TaxID=1797707 RepID=A0A1F5G2S1_9BACT|nr:MAG: hypothetical protein A2Z23_02255 [Candidatus Curtissbacteria bacterium RBG_16_39_7]